MNTKTKIDPKTKSEIVALFREDIKRSIYPIVTKYCLTWRQVKNIRKPLLEEKGLTYINPYVCHKDTKKSVENWQGRTVTKAMSEQILPLINLGKTDAEIEKAYNISKEDTFLFRTEYAKQGENYIFAPEL